MEVDTAARRRHHSSDLQPLRRHASHTTGRGWKRRRGQGQRLRARVLGSAHRRRRNSKQDKERPAGVPSECPSTFWRLKVFRGEAPTMGWPPAGLRLAVSSTPASRQLHASSTPARGQPEASSRPAGGQQEASRKPAGGRAGPDTAGRFLLEYSSTLLLNNRLWHAALVLATFLDF